MKIYFNQRTRDTLEPGQKFTQPSLTVPDQTMTIREIMERYARGLPVAGAKVELWDEENDLPDPRTLDLAERQELAEQYAQEIQEIKRNQKAAKKAKEKGAEPTPPNPPNTQQTPAPDPAPTP